MKQHQATYSIRKLGIGVISIAVASVIWLLSSSAQVAAQAGHDEYSHEVGQAPLQSQASGEPVVDSEQMVTGEVEATALESEASTTDPVLVVLPEGYTEDALKSAAQGNPALLNEASAQGMAQQGRYQAVASDQTRAIEWSAISPDLETELTDFVASLVNPLRQAWGHHALTTSPASQAASRALAQRYQDNQWSPLTQGLQPEWQQDAFGTLARDWGLNLVSLGPTQGMSTVAEAKAALYDSVLNMLFASQANAYASARNLLTLDTATASSQPLLALGWAQQAGREGGAGELLLFVNVLRPLENTQAPDRPVTPTPPQEPLQPGPVDPVGPSEPSQPTLTEPVGPMDPSQPTPQPEPVQPQEPATPEEPEPDTGPTANPRRPEARGELEPGNQPNDAPRDRRSLPNLVEKGSLMANKQGTSESQEADSQESSSSSLAAQSQGTSTSQVAELSERALVSSADSGLPSSGEDTGYWLLLGGVSAVAAAAGLIYLKQVEIRRHRG